MKNGGIFMEQKIVLTGIARSKGKAAGEAR